MNTKNRILYFLVFICIPNLISSQINKNDLGSWGMFFNQTRIHNKWSLHSEIQFRSYEIKPNTEQLLIRGGINYHYNKSVIFTGGYGWITNYKDDADGDFLKPPTVNENRIWQQMQLKNNIGRVFLEHRYRIEQRWINQSNSTNYKNRIRYLLRLSIPINKKEIKKNTIFVGLHDEVFIHLNSTPFDRNRLYGALGYQFNLITNIQIGYLFQSVGSVSKQYLQLSLNYNPDLRKKNE